MWNVSDESLLAGFATGDQDAATAFVARFRRRVYGIARVVTGDATTAEDVAQEALLRAWRNASSFDPRRGSVSSWINSITRNAAIDALRINGRARPEDPAAFVLNAEADHAPGPGAAAVAHDEAAWLQSALATLPDEQRRAVLLAGILGHTAQEIADHEQIPLGTAKSRIRLAMAKLRDVLVEEQAQE